MDTKCPNCKLTVLSNDEERELFGLFAMSEKELGSGSDIHVDPFDQVCSCCEHGLDLRLWTCPECLGGDQQMTDEEMFSLQMRWLGEAQPVTG
jgi:hypothetical protein